jgi:MoxR-like ATPase
MLTVNRVLSRLFVKNEANEVKWTDEQIAEMINQRFPGTAASRVEEIQNRRRSYNLGLPPFSEDGPAEDGNATHPVSRRYDANGHVIPETVEPRTRTVTKKVVVEGGVTEERVQEIVQDSEKRIRQYIEDRPSITVVVPGKSEVTMPGGTVHKAFHEVLMNCMAGLPTLLVGPAGSGKTHLAGQVAAALGRTFTFNSCSEGMKESDLYGRTLPTKDGEWTFRPAPFTHTFKNGGIHLLDEVDACDPNLLVSVNAALANGLLTIPFSDDIEPIAMHGDFQLIAAANTFGLGADTMYVGRNQLDAATLNRFGMTTVEVDYDRDLERSIAYAHLKDDERAEALLAWAWRIRDGIYTNKLRRIMGTRNIIQAAKLLMVGAKMDDLNARFFRGWKVDEKRALGVA